MTDNPMDPEQPLMDTDEQLTSETQTLTEQEEGVHRIKDGRDTVFVAGKLKYRDICCIPIWTVCVMGFVGYGVYGIISTASDINSTVQRLENTVDKYLNEFNDTCSRYSQCDTIDGNSCTFPFTYHDTQYSTCIFIDSQTKLPWCGTNGDASEWGYCSPTCAPAAAVAKSCAVLWKLYYTTVHQLQEAMREAGGAVWRILSWLLCAFGFGFALSFLLLLVLRFAANAFIHIAIFSVVLLLITAGGLCIYTSTWLIVVSLVPFGMAVVICLWYCCVKSRIPFAATLIKTAVQVYLHHPTVAFVPFLFILLNLLVLVCMSGCAAKAQESSYLWPAFVFTYYWASSTFRNMSHFVVASVAAAWFFKEKIGEDEMHPVAFAHPIRFALKRCFGYSFGSIILGSIWAGLVDVVRRCLKWASNCPTCLICLFKFLLWLFEKFMEYFNIYAFIEVAIWGKAYFPSAAITMKLFLKAGLYMVINDSLVAPVFSLIVLVSSGACAALVAFLAYEAGDNSVGYAIMYWLLSWIVSSFAMSIMFSLVLSVVQTLFVCVMEDPKALKYKDEELYAAIVAESAKTLGCCCGGRGKPQKADTPISPTAATPYRPSSPKHQYK